MNSFPELGRMVLATCPECEGSGWYWPPNDDGSTICTDCGGSGQVKTWPDATPAQIQAVVNRVHTQLLEWKHRA